MFAFLNRYRSRRGPCRTTRGRKLRFETLESRAVLSAVPVIDALTFVEDYMGGVTISGHVVDECADGLAVTLTGAANGSATVRPDGNFSTYVWGAQLGTVSATVIDGDGQQSAPATVAVTSNAPLIASFSVVEGEYGGLIVTGQVIDEIPGGLTVIIGGAVQTTLTTEWNGTFNVTLYGGQLGTISATVTDWFGQASIAATASITSDAPEIINFSAIVDETGQLRIEGQVVDENPQYLTVAVTWLGQSYTVCTDYQGRFWWSCGVTVGQDGWASAKSTDWWGLDSNEPEILVPVI